MNTSNLLTLADVRSVVKRFVDNGTCNTDTLDARIAEAESRLWAKADWRLSRKRVRIRCANQMFPLPIEVEKILKVDIDGTPANVFDPPYEFLDSGPGDLDAGRAGSGYKDLVDQGEAPTQFDIPVQLTWDPAIETSMGGSIGEGYQLIAFSAYAEDADLSLTIRGLTKLGDEIRSEIDGTFGPGEKIQINQWSGGVEGTVNGVFADYHVSTGLFREITRVYKPVTKGPVSLFAVDLATNTVYLLSKMTPDITVPSYRRYRITNRSTDQYGHAPTHVLAWVKLRHTRATRADDVVAIQNISAIKNMIMAINFENQFDLAKGNSFEANAIRLLVDQKTDEEQPSSLPVVIDVLASMSGRAMNYGII